MKIKKIGIVLSLGLISFIWASVGFSEQYFQQFQRKTTAQSQKTQSTATQNQNRQSQTQGARIHGTQSPQQMQRQENTQAYTYKCRIDSTNRGVAEPYFIHYDIYRERYYQEHRPQPNEPILKTVNIPLRCDAIQPQGRSGWYMSIEFNTLDEAMNFFNFIQNKTLYGRGVPYGTQMEMLEFSSYYIGDR